MKKTIFKTRILVPILALLLGVAMLFGTNAPTSAHAGTTGSQIAGSADFMGEEIDFRNWKYDRGAGLGVRALRKTFSFTNPVLGGDFALKSLNKAEGNGTIVEMDIQELNLGNGDLSLTYGCLNGDADILHGKPYWNLMEQTDTDGMRDKPYGSMQTFNMVDGVIKLTLFEPRTKTGAPPMDKESVKGDETLKFKTANGATEVSGDTLELDFGTHLTSGILYKKTLRVYWDNSGTYEMSVRDIGGELSSRYKVLQSVEAKSMRAAMPGYFGLTNLCTGNKMKVDLSNLRIYQIDNKEVDSNGTVLVSDFGASSEKITDYALLATGGNYETGALGSLNTMHFSKTHDVESPLISRKEVYSSVEIENAVDAEFGLLINEMTQGKKFGFVFGLERLDGDVGADGSAFLYFKKDGESILYGLSAFKDGAEVKLLEPTVLSNIQDDIAVQVSLKSDGKIVIKLNGESAYTSAAAGEISASGYLGFSQTGGYTTQSNYIDVELTSLKIVNTYYDKPFTPELFNANFDNDEYNVNDIYMKGSQMVVTDGAYVFNGAGENSGFGTRMQYSNFELDYTLFDVKTKKHFDPKIGKTFAASAQQGVSFGLGGEDVESSMISTYESFSKQSYIYFDAEKNTDGSIKGTAGMHFIYKGAYQQSLALPAKYNFFKEGYTDKVMIKLTMVEGVMTVNLKLPSEARYTTIYTFNGFDSGFTSTGYICFWAGGNDFVANKNYELRSFYKIDDIKIENLDNKPNYKETEFVSNRVDPIPDFDYNDTWTDDFLVGNRKDTDGKGCGAASAATLAVAIGALGFALLKIKR